MMYARGCIFAGAAAFLAGFEGGLATRAESERQSSSTKFTCYIRQDDFKVSDFKYGDKDTGFPIGFEIQVESTARNASVACGTTGAAFGGSKNSPFEMQVKKGLFIAVPEKVGEKTLCKCTDKAGTEYLEEPFVLNSAKTCDAFGCWEEYESVMYDEARSFVAAHNKDRSTKLSEHIKVMKLSHEGLWMVDNEYQGPPLRLPTAEEFNDWLVKKDARIQKMKKNKNKNKPQPAGADSQGDGGAVGLEKLWGVETDHAAEPEKSTDTHEIDCTAAIEALKKIEANSRFTDARGSNLEGNKVFKQKVNAILKQLGLSTSA